MIVWRTPGAGRGPCLPGPGTEPLRPVQAGFRRWSAVVTVGRGPRGRVVAQQLGEGVVQGVLPASVADGVGAQGGRPGDPQDLPGPGAQFGIAPDAPVRMEGVQQVADAFHRVLRQRARRRRVRRREDLRGGACDGRRGRVTSDGPDDLRQVRGDARNGAVARAGALRRDEGLRQFRPQRAQVECGGGFPVAVEEGPCGAAAAGDGGQGHVQAIGAHEGAHRADDVPGAVGVVAVAETRAHVGHCAERREQWTAECRSTTQMSDA